jgi:DNA-binding NarL/FixJ family response regulator
MRLGKYLSSLTKPELEELKELLNLTEDEEEIFKGLSKGRSKTQIAIACLVSSSTVDNRIKSINCKLIRLKGW